MSETTPANNQRERWPSRLSFVLASMGGAVGIGNLLRYPSIAAAHAGLQWFIPYFFALFLIGIPILMLEISMGQSYAAASVGANNAIHRRLRGLGICTALIAFITVTYYVTIMAFVLEYIKSSFITPLPWKADPGAFFENSVVSNVAAVGNVTTGYLSYPDTGMVPHTVGWTFLTWVLVYLCIFRGVALTGRVVYVTMLLPLLLCFVILIRAVTLPNADKGVVQYVGRWDSSKLANGEIWNAAIIQIFFSIGTGFGYFIAYSSYNNPHANAVQDALIIAFSNSAIEVIVGFAAFAVVGFRSINLEEENLGTFVLGFLTYPDALAQLPGGNAWSFFFFLTVYLLAIDSAFALLEAFISIITDTDWGRKPRKELTIGIIVLSGFLLSLIYSTKFGLQALDAVDTWLTGITLSFATFFQCASVTSVYRYKDVISQTGMAAFATAQSTYFGSMILGIIVAHATSFFWWGILMFAAVLLVGTITAALISTTPRVDGRFGRNRFFNALWWLTCYSGDQLRHDLNSVVGRNRNWKLPVFWAPLLRWVAAPVLVSILSLQYREFGSSLKLNRDPLHIFGFTVAHAGVLIATLGFFFPDIFRFFVPSLDIEKDQKQYDTSPGITLKYDDIARDGLEASAKEESI